MDNFFTTFKSWCHSKMSAYTKKLDYKKSNIAMGKKLLDVGQDINNLLSGKPELSKHLDIGFLKVFGEVVSAVGLLFKNDDAERTLKLLAPLSSYTSLMPDFLLIISILENVQRVVEVDLKEHKDRLQQVNKDLTRIAVEATAIAKTLEDLGNSLIDIIKGEASQKTENLKIIDIHYHKIYFSLASCISDMELLKYKIDVGLRSIQAYMQKINTINICCAGVFAVAAAIIAPIAVGYFGLIAAYGSWHKIGVGTIAALSAGGATSYPLRQANRSANKIKVYYEDQKFNWQQLSEKLKTMKDELKCLRESRMTA